MVKILMQLSGLEIKLLQILQKLGTVVLLYGALFDIDKNPATGKFGVDYQHEIQWNNYSKEWNSFIVEQPSKDYFRTVFSQENYTGIQDDVNFVLISQDLKLLTLPEHFKVPILYCCYL